MNFTVWFSFVGCHELSKHSRCNAGRYVRPRFASGAERDAGVVEAARSAYSPPPSQLGGGRADRQVSRARPPLPTNPGWSHSPRVNFNSTFQLTSVFNFHVNRSDWNWLDMILFVCVRRPGELATNRGNDLLVALMENRFPLIFDSTTLPLIRDWLSADEREVFERKYQVNHSACNQLIESHVEKHSNSYPMTIGQDLTEKQKVQMALFLVRSLPCFNHLSSKGLLQLSGCIRTSAHRTRSHSVSLDIHSYRYVWWWMREWPVCGRPPP